MPDPRSRRRIRHRLVTLLALAVCAVLAGAANTAGHELQADLGNRWIELALFGWPGGRAGVRLGRPGPAVRSPGCGDRSQAPAPMVGRTRSPGNAAPAARQVLTGSVRQGYVTPRESTDAVGGSARHGSSGGADACWFPRLPQGPGRDGAARHRSPARAGRERAYARRRQRPPHTPSPSLRPTDARHPQTDGLFFSGFLGVHVPSPALLDVHPTGGIIVSAP